MTEPEIVRQNLADIRRRIEDAARQAGRDPADITLIAVSKFHGAEAIEAALAAGHRDFGESRVQEVEEKWPALLQRYPDVRLHFVGPLQTNKAARAVALCHVIHSLDRPRLARRLAAEMADQDVRRPCFIQINTGEEAQKSGVLPAAVPGFIDLCRAELGLPVEGLMCVPPIGEDPALHFAFLAELARRHGLKGLSMGMTEDFETAIRLGATHIRVGTAIFGPRPTPV